MAHWLLFFCTTKQWRKALTIDYENNFHPSYIYLYSSYDLILGILFCRILALQFRKLIDRKNEWMASLLSCKKLDLSKVWYLHLEKNISRRFEIDWVCKAQWIQIYFEEEF